MDQLVAHATRFWDALTSYMVQTSVLVQFVIVLGLLLFAIPISRRLEPRLRDRARDIKAHLGLLRAIAAVLRRFLWLVFWILLAIAYLISQVAGWGQDNHLIYSAFLLVGAWVLISVMLLSLRNQAFGRLFAIVAWAYVAATILGVADDLAVVLEDAGFTIGQFRISVLSVLKGVLLFGSLLWLAWSTGNFFERRIQGVDELTPSLRVLLGKILRIALIIFATLIALQGLGIDLTALTVLSGAVGVGIGFGLQKVVSNFISGVIILLDQSIKPGDTITLGDTFGWIRELRARFVSVVTRDGREYLIPNEDFITREVVNWSFSDNFVRVDVKFGVSYSADPHEVSRLAIEAAGKVDRVDIKTYPPVCWLTGFGDSSLDFVLRFWIDDPQNGLTNIRGKVLLALWDSFKAHGVGIPFPHREVIMRNPVQVVDER